jgi:SH3 domain-containing protein
MVIRTSMALRPANADDRPTVQVPGAEADHPSWTKVAVIAAIGFVVGLAWPRIAGVRLGPSLPAASASASSAPVESTPAASTSGSMGAPANVASAAAADGASSLSGAVQQPVPDVSPTEVTVPRGYVIGCKTAQNESLKGAECGALSGLDAVVMPRLRRLANCPEASGAAGKLHLVLTVDFARESLTTELSRSHPISSADAWLGCARSDLAGVRIAGISHEHPKYSVAYAVALAGSAPAAPSAVIPSAVQEVPPEVDSRTAQVEWEVAIVRDAPKTGKVIARLQRGTTLRIGSPKDGWWPVKYGDGYTSEGWVYRGAIGR